MCDNYLPNYIINDDWILSRISSQSTSFSGWVKNLMINVEKSLDKAPPEFVEKFKKEANFEDLKTLDQELINAQKELENLGFFGKKISNFTMKILNKVQKPIQKQVKKSFKGIEDLDFLEDLDFITGKRKNLSSALYDVSKERGIKSEGLLYLIRALPDLEAFLYSTSTKKFYRDHTEHALRVAVLGDFLLEKDVGQGPLGGLISDLTDLDKNQLKDKFWWITGLIHDIGYPLGKMTTAVNYSLINQLLKCYPTLDLEFAPIEISLAWNGQQEEYLKIIEEGLSIEARKLIRKGAGFDIQNISAQKTQVFLQKSKGHPEYEYENPVKLDHGVISALSLLKGLGTPEEIKKNDEFYGYILVAKAIALHNFKVSLKDYIFKEQPLTFFLMLIDELQEWGRPIPIQVRDTYFTTELEKVTLLDEIQLQLDDELEWLMKFKNQQAKDLMQFNFNLFSGEKKKSFGRLNSGEVFPRTTINLHDITVTGQKKERKENIIGKDTIII